MNIVDRLNEYSAKYQSHGGICAEAADYIQKLEENCSSLEGTSKRAIEAAAEWKDLYLEILDRAEKAKADRDEAIAELDATREALAEAHGLVGVTPKTMFGVPLARLYQLAEAEKEGRCVTFPDFGEEVRRVLGNILGEKEGEK